MAYEKKISLTPEVDLTIELVMTRKGIYLDVIGRDGKLSSPQTVLDQLLGPVSLDPEAFGRMDPREQAAVLRRVVGIDHSSLDRKLALAREERRDVGRDHRAVLARLAAAPEIKDAPKERVDVAELTAELERRRTQNAKNEKAVNEWVDLVRGQKDTASQIEDLDAQIERLQRQLAVVRKEKEVADALVAEAAAAVDARPDPADEGEVLTKIKGAEAVNERLRKAEARAEIATREKDLSHRHDVLERRVADIEEKKARDVAEAAFPVPGLGFDPEGGVTLGSLPFEQASQSDRIRVGVAVGLAADPGIRVLLVRTASLLDEKHLSLLADLAEEHDAQVIAEVVGDREADDRSVVVRIVDGTTAAKAPEEGETS